MSQSRTARFLALTTTIIPTGPTVPSGSSADADGHEPRRQAAPSGSTPRDRPSARSGQRSTVLVDASTAPAATTSADASLLPDWLRSPWPLVVVCDGLLLLGAATLRLRPSV
ncbi:MAG: hypothetical protein H6529_10265 [Nocardioides sp.]|nr:hypothetical protein [Nocardioidaceae bacterium]MCB8956850.1 hypothetical protein [Nocardioides sp.]